MFVNHDEQTDFRHYQTVPMNADITSEQRIKLHNFESQDIAKKHLFGKNTNSPRAIKELLLV